ncbi:hypothetical protein D3C76_1218070 [compost metagenome]
MAGIVLHLLFAQQIIEVVVVDFFFRIRQSQESLKQPFEPYRVGRIETQLLHRMLDGMPSRSGRQDQFHAFRPHLFGGHDLIYLLILQQTVLVNAGGMSKRVIAGDRLIDLHIKTR